MSKHKRRKPRLLVYALPICIINPGLPLSRSYKVLARYDDRRQYQHEEQNAQSDGDPE